MTIDIKTIWIPDENGVMREYDAGDPYAQEVFQRNYETVKAQRKEGWQPIETAPKDGSLVLAWREGWDKPCFVRWIFNSRTETTFWNDSIEYDFYENETEPPTHWLPIPEIPVNQAKEISRDET